MEIAAKNTVVMLGNVEFGPDSLPLRIMPELETRLPEYDFRTMDPNEDWDMPESLTVVDTVINAEEPMVHDSLENFADPPRMSMHDFDALTQLRMMLKLGRLKKVRVIGLPPGMDEAAAVEFVESALTVERTSS